MAIVTGQRDVTLSGRVIPVVTTLVFAMMSTVPVHLPGLSMVTPAFALMAVFHWTVYRPDLLPPVAVFAIGIFLDLLGATPYVGLSALVLLIGRTVLVANRPFFVNRPFAVFWGGFVLFAGAVLGAEWAALGLLHKGSVAAPPVIFQTVLTVGGFPVGSYLLAVAHRAFVLRP